MILPVSFIVNGRDDALLISRSSSIILMNIYLCLLYFELFTHRDIMEEEHELTEDLVIREG